MITVPCRMSVPESDALWALHVLTKMSKSRLLREGLLLLLKKHKIDEVEAVKIILEEEKAIRYRVKSPVI